MEYLQDHAKISHHNYFDVLAGLRGFAVIWVFAHHIRFYDAHIPVQFDLLGINIKLHQY